MAKKKSRSTKKRNKKFIQREFQRITNRKKVLNKRDRPVINDRRRFLPENDDLPRYDDGNRVNLQSNDEINERTRTFNKKKVTGRIAFVDSRRVTVCHRRTARRRALFKFKKIGKGKGVSPRRLMSKYSHIVCKRR